MGEVIGTGEGFLNLCLYRDSMKMLRSREDANAFKSTIEKEQRIFKKELRQYVDTRMVA